MKVTGQYYDTERKRWGEKRVVPLPLNTKRRHRLVLPGGGKLLLYPQYLQYQHQSETPERIAKELEYCGHFRQYTIQGNDEPRAHCLFHQDATAHFEDDQPSYRYNSVVIKARPLSTSPKLKKLSETAKRHCNVRKWKIGANVVVYRDGKDHMGLHADNDQGETVIFTVVLRTSSNGRGVVVEPIKRKNGTPFINGDVRYEFFPEAGDAYRMNGEMQEHYKHGVVKCDKDNEIKNNPIQQRMVVVFRDGKGITGRNDRGRPLDSLAPRLPAVLPIGGNKITGLSEGEIYSRSQLRKIGGHVAQQKGVSGNQIRGCEAIIVSSRRTDELGYDYFDKLVYAVENEKGGGALLLNFRRNLPIRVFRSSHQNNNFPSPKHKSGCTGYRYDGIYSIMRFSHNVEKPASLHREIDVKFATVTDRRKTPSPIPRRLYLFHLHRIEVGKNLQNRNNLSVEDMLQLIDCEKAQSKLRRLKKKCTTRK